MQHGELTVRESLSGGVPRGTPAPAIGGGSLEPSCCNVMLCFPPGNFVVMSSSRHRVWQNKGVSI